METVDTDVFWSRVVDAPDCFGELQATDAAWHERAVVVWRVVGETLVQREGNDMLVAAWENNLGLAAADGAEPGARKVALLNHMCSEGLPVPAGLLESLLTRMLGEGRARVKHSGDTLTVSVALDTTEERIAEVQTLLDRVLPRNLVTEMEWADGLPIDYTRVEYLESTGSQYIELGTYDVVPDTGFEVDMMWRKGQTTGAFGMANDKMTLCIYGHGQIAARYAADGIGVTLGYPGYEKRHTIRKVDRRNWLNGVECASNNGEEENTGTYVLRMFGVAYGWRASVAIYCARFWQGNVVLRDVIPVLDPTGAPCMYDLVTKTPFYNSGTGDLLYPGKETEATTYSLRNRMYAKYTEHGIRRLYRVPKGYNSKEEYAEKHGFKILVETPMPEEGYWAPVWHEREDCIELEWVETEAPEEGLEP